MEIRTRTKYNTTLVILKFFEGGLDIISKLQPGNFEWRDSEIYKEGTRREFIAEEVKEVDEY